MESKEIVRKKLNEVVQEFYKAVQIADQQIENNEFLQAANTLEHAGNKAMFDEFQFAIFDSVTMSEN